MEEKELEIKVKETGWTFVIGCILLIISIFAFILDGVISFIIFFIFGLILSIGSLASNIVVRLRFLTNLILKKGEKKKCK